MEKVKRTYKARYTEQLPPIVCTPEMKNDVVQFATETGLSLSEVQRQALSLFLSKKYSDAIKNNSKTIEGL